MMRREDRIGSWDSPLSFGHVGVGTHYLTRVVITKQGQGMGYMTR